MSLPRQSNEVSGTLKTAVKQHWEAETCGVRYGGNGDRLAWFRAIAQTRYELEPCILEFAGFGEAKGLRILEIGVGAGSDFLEWCRHAQHATGVDLTEAGIALTRERLELEGVSRDRYTLRTADAEALPFADATFDIVYSWGVLHHTPETAAAYREVFRVLKPGGKMRSMIYHVPSWTGLMLQLIHGPAKGRFRISQRQAVFEHLESAGTKAYTVPEAVEVARSAGFSDVSAATRLGPGDLLAIKPSARYSAWPFRLVWALWPRWFVRMLGDRFGLYLLLGGRKSL